MQKQNKALFLDRDGTINIEKHYVYKKEDFEFIPGIIDLIRKFAEKGYLIFIVTNQGGIARGYYSETDYFQLTEWMLNEFEKNGIKITKVYYCPHHPLFTGQCNCRKPKPGMILQAIREYNVNPALSILIGDKKSDILAGENAGIGENHFIYEFIGNQERI